MLSQGPELPDNVHVKNMLPHFIFYHQGYKFLCLLWTSKGFQEWLCKKCNLTETGHNQMILKPT